MPSAAPSAQGSYRIVRQLLTESVVLSLVGGALGLAVTAGIMRAAPAMVPRRVPGLDHVGVDGTVLASAAALSIGAGLLFGTAPARAWARADLVRTLNDASAPAAGGFGRRRANIGQAMLATGQVALVLVLLTAAGLLLRSFMDLVTLRPGVRAGQCRHRPRRRPGLATGDAGSGTRLGGEPPFAPQRLTRRGQSRMESPHPVAHF